MSYVTANGVAITTARICLPRCGAWHGDLALEDDTLLDKQIVININGVEFHCTGSRIAVAQGTGLAQFIAGAGGLGAEVKPKMYRDVGLSIPLGDILKVANETLATDAAPDAKNQQLPKWTVAAGKAGAALNALVKLALKDAVWRFHLDGTLWLGKESWPKSKAEGEVVLEDPLADRAVMFFEVPSLEPGQVYRDRRVSYVEHIIREGSLRSHVHFERDPP